VSELKATMSTFWSWPQAVSLAVVALLLGMCGGWLVRRSFAAAPAARVVVSAGTENAPANQPAMPAQAAPPPNFGLQGEIPSDQALKQAADSQAASLLEQLKAAPTNAGLLAQIGNIYYDAKQYSIAIDYYDGSLNAQPGDNSVRTDLGTAYWYTGDANAAIAQFQKVLASEPTKPDTLFNLGIVTWQGKHDGPAAIAAWQKLLDTNPNYQNKEKVLQLIAQAQGR
jgi:tetratricopeptide (TPR) repeat protein